MRLILKEVAITLAADARNLLAAAIGIIFLIWAINLLAGAYVVANAGVRAITPQQHTRGEVHK